MLHHPFTLTSLVVFRRLFKGSLPNTPWSFSAFRFIISVAISASAAGRLSEVCRQGKW